MISLAFLAFSTLPPRERPSVHQTYHILRQEKTELKNIDSSWWNLDLCVFERCWDGFTIGNPIINAQCIYRGSIKTAIYGDVSARFLLVCQEELIFLSSVFSWAEIWCVRWRKCDSRSGKVENAKNAKCENIFPWVGIVFSSTSSYSKQQY